jgi:hypothetical protein
MSERTKKIFLPGLAAMMIGVIGDRFLWWTHTSMPNIYWLGKAVYPSGARGFIAIEPIMLMFFVVGGALAAWSSSQHNSSRNERIVAAELPAIVMASFLILSMMTSLVVGLFFAKLRVDGMLMVYAFAGYMAGWVLLPAVALMVGALPFASEKKGPTHIR